MKKLLSKTGYTAIGAIDYAATAAITTGVVIAGAISLVQSRCERNGMEVAKKVKNELNKENQMDKTVFDAVFNVF